MVYSKHLVFVCICNIHAYTYPYIHYMLHTVLHITSRILHMHYIHFTFYMSHVLFVYYILHIIHNNVCKCFILEVLKQALIPSKRCRPDVATLGTSMAQSGGLQISNQRVEASEVTRNDPIICMYIICYIHNCFISFCLDC